jgi:hypothetical protein
MSAIGLFLQTLRHIDFSASQFLIAAETPGGVLGLLGLIGAAVAQYLQAKRKAAAPAK